MNEAAKQTFPTVVRYQRMVNWRLIFASIAYWSWQIITKCVLGIIYLVVISEGLRVLMPALGQKIHKLPGFGTFAQYEATYKLDLAHFFSLFVLVAAWTLWGWILRIFLEYDEPPQREAIVVVGLGTIILVADAVLFYAGITQLSWGGSAFSFSAVVATGAYLATLVFVTFVAAKLKQRVLVLRREA